MEPDRPLNPTAADRATKPVARVSAPPAPDWAWLRPALVALVARPGLWATALSQLGRMAARGWWRRWPPLPVPDPRYLAFRLQTQYGDASQPPHPDDLVAYLEWCRRSRRSMG